MAERRRAEKDRYYQLLDSQGGVVFSGPFGAQEVPAIDGKGVTVTEETAALLRALLFLNAPLHEAAKSKSTSGKRQ
jgi:hypothetical protein